jgi:hypothetical protein
MMNDQTTHMLARLELGFRTDAARLKDLEKDLALTIACGRRFADAQGSPEGREAVWQAQWDVVEAILRRIRVHVDDMDDDIAHLDGERLKNALRAWEGIQSEDALLVAALDVIRSRATELNADGRADWLELSGKLDAHLETLCACAQALRVKLELLKDHSRDEVDLLVQRVLNNSPERAGTDGGDGSRHDHELRQAAAELKEERHEYTGIGDVVKGLLMWVETTEERAERDHVQAVAKAGAAPLGAGPG